MSIRRTLRALARQLRPRPGEPTLAEVIRTAISSRLRDTHTAMPGIVQSYDKTTQTATVLPAIRGVIFTSDDEPVLEDLPVLANVPVGWYRGGGASLQLNLVKGDTGFLVFSEAATGLWRSTGEVSEPGDLRRHDLSYPIFLPCCAPDASPLTPIGSDEGAVLDASGKIRLGGAAADYVALAPAVQAQLTKITTWAGLVGVQLAAAGHSVAALASFDPVTAAKVKAE